MALTETTDIDQIEIVKTGVVQVRYATSINRDGFEIAKTYHRASFTPGQDVSNEDLRIKNVCMAVWTPEVVLAYESQIDQTQNEIPQSANL
jgi:hypothetical protein